jgi:hypothetical protein
MDNSDEIESVGNFYTQLDGNQLYIDVFALKYGLWKISIYDNNGKLLSSEAMFLNRGKNILPIAFSKNNSLIVKFESSNLSQERIFQNTPLN